jgi:hypothetical protein
MIGELQASHEIAEMKVKLFHRDKSYLHVIIQLS